MPKTIMWPIALYPYIHDQYRCVNNESNCCIVSHRI